MANLTKLYNDEDLSNKYKEYAKKCKENFNKEFYNKKKKSLYDVLGDDKIRPNQLFSLSLTYPIIDPSSDIANEIFNTVTKKLLLPKGLRTLAQDEENYVGIYEGGVYERDTSYHQGITWPWLLGPYFDAFVNIINSASDEKRKTRLIKAYNKFIDEVAEIFENEFYYSDCVVGNISELYDSEEPYKAKGSPAQAWSIAEVFRIIFQGKDKIN